MSDGMRSPTEAEGPEALLLDARRVRSLFERLFEAAPDPTLLADGRGRILRVNQQVRDVLGYTPEELVGEPVEVLLPHRFRGGHGAKRAAFLAAPEVRPMGAGRELHALCADGSELSVEISLSPVPLDDATGVIATVRDITDRRRAEAELQAYTARLEAMNDELRALDRLKNDFVSMASHEIRTPLTVLQGFVEILLRSPYAREDEGHRSQLEVIQRNVLRLGRLTNNLLVLARIEEGAVNSSPTVVDAHALAVQVVEELAFDAVVRDGDGAGPATMWADPDLVTQILVNLLSNATKYGRPPIKMATRVAGDRVFLSVTDAGGGVPPDFVPRLFERFAQASTGARREASGSGIGLTVVRELASVMGGEVTYERAPDGGARFLVDLPRATETDVGL